MNVQILKSSCFFIFLVVLISSCSSIKLQEELHEAELASYYYKTFRINSTKPLDGLDTTYFVVTYPEFNDENINSYVQEHLVLDSGKSTVEEMGKEFINSYDEFYDQAEFKRPWFQDKRDSVKVQTESYIGFNSHFETYTGGAHGLYYTLFNNYSIPYGHEILIGDIIGEEFYTSLTKVAEDLFREQEQISLSHSLTDGYFFDQGVFSLPDNFTLEADGILFLYNIYEIKPYVAGYTELLVPYTSISNMLTDEGRKIMIEIKNKI